LARHRSLALAQRRSPRTDGAKLDSAHMTRRRGASVILGLASVGVSVGAAVGAHADFEFWGTSAILCAIVAGTLATAAVFAWTTRWLAVPIFVGVAVGMATFLVTFGVSCSTFCR
jgi:peptidoglycan/LPS O-acetylase OafA/YrhL